MNALGDIWYGNYVHPYINTRDVRLKMREHIRQAQSDWKVAELSLKRMIKCLQKLFKPVVNELKI